MKTRLGCPALAILFVGAAVYGVYRLDRRALTILAFALPYYALISISQVRFARYSLPLFPAAVASGMRASLGTFGSGQPRAASATAPINPTFAPPYNVYYLTTASA